MACLLCRVMLANDRVGIEAMQTVLVLLVGGAEHLQN